MLQCGSSGKFFTRYKKTACYYGLLFDLVSTQSLFTAVESAALAAAAAQLYVSVVWIAHANWL